MDPPPRTKREAYRKALITPLTLTPPPPRPSLFTKLTLLSPSKLAPGPKVAPAATECEEEQLQKLVHALPFLKSGKKRLSKQLSMCETARDRAWERRRRQMMMRQGSCDNLTDEDMSELKGSIELGFGFKEDGVEDRHRLCNTLPALDLYFAVNRGFSPSPVSTPRSGAGSSSTDSPTSDDSFKICSPGEDPQQVKTKLRHWAQAVACSVMQSF